MSATSNRLKDEARALGEIADELDLLLDTCRRHLEGMMSGHLLAGPIADETATGLTDHRRRCQQSAQLLRSEALSRKRQADQVENTDGAMTDIGDFMTGRDFTPWG